MRLEPVSGLARRLDPPRQAGLGTVQHHPGTPATSPLLYLPWPPLATHLTWPTGNLTKDAEPPARVQLCHAHSGDHFGLLRVDRLVHNTVSVLHPAVNNTVQTGLNKGPARPNLA